MLVGFVPLAHVLPLHVVDAWTVAAVGDGPPPRLAALLLSHLDRHDQAAIVQLRTTTFGYLAVSRTDAVAEPAAAAAATATNPAAALVLAALDLADTASWLSRLEDPKAAAALARPAPATPATVMSYSSAKEDQSALLWLTRESLQVGKQRNKGRMSKRDRGLTGMRGEGAEMAHR